MSTIQDIENATPVAPLKLIVLPSARELGNKINQHLVNYRKQMNNIPSNDPAFQGYVEDSYLINYAVPRFGSGEGKGNLFDTVRGKDLYFLVDVCNHSLTYKMFGYENHMSPDDHYQDLKRMIATVEGKAHRINVIMPFMYEGRQHKRSGRESLDCAYALEELAQMGVNNFITFDCHDPRVQNAAPLCGFDNFTPNFQFAKTLLNNVDGLVIDKNNTVVISPDEGALDRAVYFSSVLGVDTGMFYKRRDYTKIINGKNPIVAHEFLGDKLEGKDVIIIDDMISSGDSMIDTSKQLKEMGAKRVFICCTFGLFTNGVDAFDKAYNRGHFDRVITTNLTYTIPEILDRPYYLQTDMSEFTANIIDFMNHDISLTNALTPTEQIQEIVKLYNERSQS